MKIEENQRKTNESLWNQRKTNEIRWKSTNNRRSFRYVSMPVLEAFETFLLFRVGSVLPSIVECCWDCLTCTLVLFGQPFHHCLWNTCSLSFAVCVKNATWSGASIISCLKFRRLFCTSSVKLSCPVAFQQASQASPTVNAKPKYTPLSKHVLQGTCQLTETIASSSNVEGKRNSSHERLPNATFSSWAKHKKCRFSERAIKLSWSTTSDLSNPPLADFARSLRYFTNVATDVEKTRMRI